MQDSAHTNTHVLIIEDDASINEVVEAFLGKKGFVCTQAYSGSEAKMLLAQNPHVYDLVITDLMLPGASGQELVELIRQGQQVPIIVTSALDTPEQKVSLLELGADDYLAKPFDLEELYARVMVQLRHAQSRQAASEGSEGTTSPASALATSTGRNTGAASQAATSQRTSTGLASSSAPVSAQASIQYGQWTLYPESRTFEAAGEPVKLTRLEYNIIETLIGRPTKVFTKQELFEIAWSEECFIEEKAINVHISNIRAKLKASKTHEYIETVWGIGFKLVPV